MQYIENYTDTTKEKFQLLLLAETPQGFFTNLRELLTVLEKDIISQNKFSKFIDEINKKNNGILELKEKNITWINEKLALMRSEKAAKNCEVKQKLDNLEEVLTGEYCDIRSGGILSTLRDHFFSAYFLLAKYGETTKCSDWLKIYTSKQDVIFDNLNLENFRPQHSKITPFSSNGKKLSKRLHHGFISAVVHPNRLYLTKEGKTRLTIEWGEVERVIYPKEFAQLSDLNNFDNYAIKLDMEGDEILKSLLLLCKYIDLDPKPIHTLPRPKTIIEADIYVNEQLLQCFLSGFRAHTWEDAPLSKNDILKSLSKLLLLLQIKEPFNNPGKAKTALAQKRYDYSLKVISQHLEALSKEEKRSFTVKEAIEYVNASKPPFHPSETQIKKACSHLIKNTDWNPKPGPKSQ